MLSSWQCFYSFVNSRSAAASHELVWISPNSIRIWTELKHPHSGTFSSKHDDSMKVNKIKSYLAEARLWRGCEAGLSHNFDFGRTRKSMLHSSQCFKANWSLSKATKREWSHKKVPLPSSITVSLKVHQFATFCHPQIYIIDPVPKQPDLTIRNHGSWHDPFQLSTVRGSRFEKIPHAQTNNIHGTICRPLFMKIVPFPDPEHRNSDRFVKLVPKNNKCEVK